MKPAPSKTRGRAGRLVLTGLAVLAILLGFVVGGRWYRLPDRVAAALPALPARILQLPALHERVRAAQAQTSVRATALAGVAELGRLYHANGYAAEAASCWRLLQAEEGDEAKWPYYLADAARLLSDMPQAVAAFEEAARHAPEYSPVWLHLAGLAFKTGDLASAEAHFRRRLELVPSDVHARLGLARVAQQQGRPAEARQAIEALVKETPKFAPAHNLYAEMLAAEGKPTEATHHRWLGREAGRFREPDDPWLDELQEWCLDPARLQLVSTVYYQTGQPERAQAVLERAIQLAPSDARGFLLLGELYLKRANAAAAREQFERGLAHVSTDAERVQLTANLADALRLLEQPDQALARLDEALKSMSKAFELHNARGLVLLDLGRFDEAVAAYTEALRYAPNDADTNHSLGVALMRLGRREAAAAAFKQALTLRPTFPKSLLSLGQLELEAGRLESAGTYLRPLYEFHPGQPLARQLLAHWHYRSGLAASAKEAAAEAEEHYRAGLALEPEHPELNANLGVQYLITGRLNEARPLLETYRRVQPANPQGALFMGQLYARLGQIDDAIAQLTEGERLARVAGNASTAAVCREILQQLGQARRAAPR